MKNLVTFLSLIVIVFAILLTLWVLYVLIKYSIEPSISVYLLLLLSIFDGGIIYAMIKCISYNNKLD